MIPALETLTKSLAKAVRVKVSGLGALDGASVWTRESVRGELRDLGLLGSPFTPDDYRAALGLSLGMRILVEEVPDLSAPAWRIVLGKQGPGAEVVCKVDETEAVVLIRDALRRTPWPTFDLALYHELSHLAAGHHRLPKRHRDARLLRRFRSGALESEARQRAEWLLVAGTLGSLPAPTELDRVA